VFLEDFADVVGSDVEVLLDFGDGGVFLVLHLLMDFAEVREVELALVGGAVLGDLPEGEGGDGVDAGVGSGVVGDVLAHLDHGEFLELADLAAGADSHDEVLGLDDGDEVDPALEHGVHLFNQVLPDLDVHAQHLAQVELLEVALLLEARTVDGVGGHVLEGEDVLVPLPLDLLLLPVFLLHLRLLLHHLLLALHLLLVLLHDLEDGEETRSGCVDDVLVQLQHEAAVPYELPPLLEVLVEVGFLLQLDAASCQTG